MDLALPTGRNGRILAVGLALLLLAVAWLALAQPLIRLYSDRAETLGQQSVLAHRMALLAATLPDLRLQAEAEAGSGPAPNALLEGATDAIAGAALQQRVQDMAAQAGATLSSTETLAAVQAGAYRRIGLRIACTAPWPVLVKLLQLIDQAAPRMLIDNLKVHGRRLSVQPVEPPLETEFTIVAFRTAATPADGG